MIVCPVCSVGNSTHYGDIDGFAYYQCDSCQSLCIDPSILSSIDEGRTLRPSDEGYWKMESDSARMRASGESLTRAGEAILYARRPVHRFLDVGAGGGFLLDELIRLYPEEKTLFHAVELYPSPQHSVHENFKIGSVATLEGKFDAGVCIEVLELLTPKNLESLVSDLSRVSEIDSLWLFNTDMPDFVIRGKNPGDLAPLSRGHIMAYSLKGLSPIFEKYGVKIQECPGKSFSFIVEFRPSVELPFEQRFTLPLEYNKRLLTKSGLLYQASFESARSYFYFHEFLERTKWAQRQERELLESKAALSHRENRIKREIMERDSQIHSLRQDLEAITASKSWVVTKHLRKIAGKIPSSIRGEI